MSNFQWPSHLVVFSNLLEIQDGKMGLILIEKGYKVSKRFGNGKWHDDVRRKGEVLVLEWEE